MQEKNGLQKIIAQFDRFAYYVDPKVERDIEENRKGQFRFRFQNEKGEPLDGVKIKVTQTRHAFHFGATTFFLHQMETPELNAAYEEKFKRIFNYAVIPLYWDTLEPEEGKPRFEKDSPFISRRPPLDEAIGFCEQNGLDMKGHCLIYNSFQPSWLSDDNREIKIKIDRRLGEIAERYGNQFTDVDVINEMLTIYKNSYPGNGCRNLQITDERDHEKWCFDLCKRHFPHSRLFWNEGCYETFGDPQYTGDKSVYYLMLKRWLSEGAPIEGIGMQFHAFDETEIQQKAIYNPYRTMDVLERYSDFGLPIHLSEVSIPSWSNEREDEDVQAELVKRMYRLWFSSKNVESITWWNMVDGTAYGDENRFFAGLLRNDMTHKKAYDVLDELINKSWRTEATLTTDEQGRAYFRGFFGEYDVKVGGSTHELRFCKENTGYYHVTAGPMEQKISL